MKKGERMTPESRPGDRLRLICTTDPHTRLSAGALGTIRFIDGCGTVHVAWDDGHVLGLIPGIDHFEILPGPPAATARECNAVQRPARTASASTGGAPHGR
jgi:hypothetical protein